MAASTMALRPLLALTLLAVLSYPSLAATKPPPTYNRLCQQRELTSQPQWRKCAELTVAEWNRVIVDNVIRSNFTAASAIYAGIIDPKIVLRLEPVGTFTGLEMVMEYVYIYSSPTGQVQYLKPQSYTIRRFTASRPIAVATVDYTYLNFVNGETANLTFEQWFRFDSYSRVATADFTIDRFAEALPALGVDAVFNTDPNITLLLQERICNASATYCRTPSLQQYADVAACKGFLSSLPVVNPLRIQSNTVLCRFMHYSIVGYAPEIHCPHLGPSGGGMCVDKPYSAYYAPPFPAGTFV